MKLVDMHCDTFSKMYQQKQKGEPYDLKSNGLHIDLEKLKKGNYLLQNFAMYIDLQETIQDKEDPFQKVIEMIALYYEQLKKYEEMILPVYSYHDILKNRDNGTMSALLTVEEGGVCKGKMELLQILYRLGVRMLTLTWNYPNELGFPNLEKHKNNFPNPYEGDEIHGLTDRGIGFLYEMEKIGMIVDVSHLSDKGFYDVATHATKPFVASHSNSRSICPWVRNLTDDMIRVLSQKGGVTGLNFCPAFLEDAPFEVEIQGSIDAIVAHAKQIVNVGGIDCLGIGTDFDGIKGHKELPDAGYMELLVDRLQKNGFKNSDLDKILRDNVLRVYQACL